LTTKRKPTKTHGLTDRERAFVKERRADPIAPNWLVAERAGYSGTKQRLGERARKLLAKPKIASLVFAPVTAKELAKVSDEDLKAEITRRLTLILTSDHATNADKIKAADKLLATIPGGYVPVQLDARGQLTMEMLVHAMGGAPAEYAPPLMPPPRREDA
jgi:hypothetical protein